MVAGRLSEISGTDVQTQALNSFVGSGRKLVPADPHRHHWRSMPQLAKLADHQSKRGSRQTSDARMPNLSNGFDKLAHWTARHAGRPATFALALAIIVVWGVTGPIFQWSDTWQLIINTGTTIVTFLMVFLIQNTMRKVTQRRFSSSSMNSSGSTERRATACCGSRSSPRRRWTTSRRRSPALRKPARL